MIAYRQLDHGKPFTVQKVQTKKEAQTLLPRVIAISSGKGGVGKSSIAVNLGISLAKSGARVCLLDADTGLANANILLGLTPQFSLEHVLYGAKPIEDILLDGPHGMKIVPGAHGISECVNLHPRQQLRLTRELARIESDFDFILIDTAAGISDTTLDFVSAAHHTLVVITPEPTSLTDAFSLVKLLKRRRSTIHYHVVVNMCSSAAQAKEVYHRFCSAVEKYISVEPHLLGYILRDESMRAAVVLQNPVAMFPDSDPSCRSFVKLAEALDTATGAVPVKNSFSAYWHRQFREHRIAQSGRQEAKIQAVPDVTPVQTRDADYLSELRSRLLLLIEQGHADEEQLAAVLRECLESFIRRFEHSPLDPLRLVEQLVQSPQRDDQLLREIADRVKPWGGFANTLPVSELADVAPVLSPENSLIPDGELQLDTDEGASAAEGDCPDDAETARTSTAFQQPQYRELVAEDGVTGTSYQGDAVSDYLHRYDSNRFGSQEYLLDMLKRSDASRQTLAEFLESLA